MNNEPVAYVIQNNSDNSIGEKIAIPSWTHSFSQQFKKLEEDNWVKNGVAKIIPLYTHPAKELNAGGEQVKNATYWKRQYNEMSALNDRLKSSLYHANEQIKYLESHPAKTLTDEELTLLTKCIEDCIATIEYRIDVERLAFKGYEHCSELESLYEESKNARQALAILRKANEK